MRHSLVFLVALLLALPALAEAATSSPPTASTGPVSSVGPTSATVGGTVDPKGLATTWYVEYGTSSSYGSKTSTQSAGSGTSSQAVSATIAGLQPGTSYHYRLVATNADGTSQGADGIFTTSSPPEAITGAASSIGATSATVAGTVNPNGRSTTWVFEYGTSTSYGSKTAAKSAGSTSARQTVSAALAGLTPGRLYHYRLVATSDAGTTDGSDQTFSTIAPPIVVTGAATSIAPMSATLNGTVDSDGISASWWFEYGTTTGYGSKTSTKTAASATGSVTVSAALAGLTPGRLYHYRLVATSDAGTTDGSDQTFSTIAPPIVVTGAATNIAPTSATLNGTVNPNGISTSRWFEYGTTTGYGLKTSTKSAGSGTATLNESAGITGLTPGRLYHYRLVATSGAGTTQGADQTFTATPPPAAATGPPSAVGPTSASVTGSVIPNGRPTSWWFEYGATTSYGSKTSTKSAGSGRGDVNVTATFTGLVMGATYHYRLVATGDAGTTRGADFAFVTATPPAVVTGAAGDVGSTSASAGGTVDTRGQPSTWWVEYGTSTAYGSRTSPANLGASSGAQPVAVVLVGLQPGMTYHFRLVGSNAAGATAGADQAFTTAVPPRSATGRASAIGPFGATVGGTIDPSGQTVSWYFEWRAFGGHPHRTRASTAGPSGGGRAVSLRLTGLREGTRYRFQLVAVGPAGTAYGGEAFFATPSLPRTADGLPVRCTILGTVGNDVLVGTPGPDVICGFGGSDRIAAGDGDDVVYAGPGNDVVLGGAGNDVLFGGAGDDRLDGGPGRDRLYGGPGNDLLLARDGERDLVDGGPDRDRAVFDKGLDRVVSL